MRIYFINLGTSGDAALIVLPDGKTMLIDAGAASPVKNLLDRLGIGKLDFMVLTHDHADHYSGFGGLSGYRDSNTKSYSYKTYSREGVYWNKINAGEVIHQNGELTVTCVASNGNIIGGGYVNPTDENARSVVLLVKYRGFDYLTGGDLTGVGPNVEDRLGDALAARGEAIDIYKVHHHGSRYSSNLYFLKKIMPEFALVSTFGSSHPYQEPFDRLNHADVHVTRIFQTRDSGSGAWAANRTIANGQILIETDGATMTFRNEGPGSVSFLHGPYDVDEEVYVEGPPHLLITEVAVGDHQYPENHDWIELYLPPGADPIRLDQLFWTDLDEAQPLATSAVMLQPGKVVILHDAGGNVGWDPGGWYNIYVQNVAGGDWNKNDDQFAVTRTKTTAPDRQSIIDAVVWGGRDWTMWSDQASDGNHLIDRFHWGDTAAGSGRFSTTDDGPAVGPIQNGYAQRIDTEDTNSAADWIVRATHSQGTPPPPPPSPPTHAPPPPPLRIIVEPESPSEGDTFAVRAVAQPYTGGRFDAYAVITGPAGTFSIAPGGALRPGIVPLAANVGALPAVYDETILRMTVPGGVSGDYRVIGGLVEAGRRVRGTVDAFAHDSRPVAVR
ncbi:MAG: MBL fold metallo-hydrolase [bacterium]|nr:MBL fold metallo-hydrolase [bacterium]